MVSDIDLDIMLSGSILDSAVVESTESPMERDYSTEGLMSFRFNRAIHPGKTRTAVFHLREIQSGDFGGTIAVYVGCQSLFVDPSLSITPRQGSVSTLTTVAMNLPGRHYPRLGEASRRVANRDRWRCSR
jgi:hypothetical protein